MKKKRSNTKRRTFPRMQRAAAPPDAVLIKTERPRLMSVDDACHYAGFGRSVGYALIRNHKIVAVKLGRRTLVDVASIDAFLATLPRIDGTTV